MITTDIDEQGILWIRLNRPEKLNALNDDVLNALAEQFDIAQQDSSVKGLILTGEGKAFCAGADINRLQAVNTETGYQFARHGQQVFNALEQLSKPSIALVNGFAFGGGCELAMSATLRIAASVAKLGQPEIKLGVIPGYGGTQRLSRLIGQGRAMELCLTGRFIDADEAFQIGLINQVVELDDLVDAGKTLMNTILGMAPIAIDATMQVIRQGSDLPLPEAQTLEALQFARTCGTQDKQIGVDAFLAKQPAVFIGE